MYRGRLRQVDVKAEHFERQVQRVEAERDAFEKKYEDSQEVRLLTVSAYSSDVMAVIEQRYMASKRELEEVVQQLEDEYMLCPAKQS